MAGIYFIRFVRGGGARCAAFLFVLEASCENETKFRAVERFSGAGEVFGGKIRFRNGKPIFFMIELSKTEEDQVRRRIFLAGVPESDQEAFFELYLKFRAGPVFGADYVLNQILNVYRSRKVSADELKELIDAG